MKPLRRFVESTAKTAETKLCKPATLCKQSLENIQFKHNRTAWLFTRNKTPMHQSYQKKEGCPHCQARLLSGQRVRRVEPKRLSF
jgi:hypothetical protein